MILGLAMHPTLPLTFPEFLDFAQKIEADTLDLRLDSTEFLSAFKDENKTLEIKQLLNQYNFRRCVHAPIIDVCMSSLNPTLQKASENAMLEAMEFAAKINASLVVSHVGRLSKDYPRKFAAKATQKAMKSLKIINERCNDLGMVFTIENDCKTEDPTLAGTKKQIQVILEAVGCKMTLDVGHANTFGKPEEYFKTFNKRIAHVHLHDNYGDKDEHLPVGEGNIDFGRLFHAMGNRISKLPLTIECHSLFGIAESATALKRHFQVAKQVSC